MVLLYPTYRSIEFPLEVLYRAGREVEVAQIRQALQNIAGTSKEVSKKSPNIGIPEALAHWPVIAETVRTLTRIRAQPVPQISSGPG